MYPGFLKMINDTSLTSPKKQKGLINEALLFF